MSQVKAQPPYPFRTGRDAMHRALREQLTRPQLLIMLLIHVEQLSLTEAAMVMQQTEADTQSLLDAARQRMRQAVLSGRLPLPTPGPTAHAADANAAAPRKAAALG